MSSFVKGFITGAVSSVLLFTFIKFLLSFIGIIAVLFIIYCVSGVNLITLPNVLLIWVFWKLFFKRSRR